MDDCGTEDDGDIFTAQVMNGRGWNDLANVEKIAYILGLHDSMLMSALTGQNAETPDPEWAAKSTVADYVAELNRFFTGRENLNIPIVIGVHYCTVKLKGERTKEELDSLVTALRRQVMAMR